jgi:threonine dehydratase
MQVPKSEMSQFRRFLSTVGYPFVDESENPAYQLFLG